MPGERGERPVQYQPLRHAEDNAFERTEHDHRRGDPHYSSTPRGFTPVYGERETTSCNGPQTNDLAERIGNHPRPPQAEPINGFDVNG
jgi:hypothetical protein